MGNIFDKTSFGLNTKVLKIKELKTRRFITLLGILFLFGCSAVSTKKLSENRKFPIFKNTLFITNNGKKWGAIDKQGNQVLPFIYDGIKEISDSVGIASVYVSSYSLNTSFPRYKYCGNYYQFTKDGVIKSSEKSFTITIEMSEKYDEKMVLKFPDRFLPKDSSINEKCFRFLEK